MLVYLSRRWWRRPSFLPCRERRWLLVCGIIQMWLPILLVDIWTGEIETLVSWVGLYLRRVLCKMIPWQSLLVPHPLDFTTHRRAIVFWKCARYAREIRKCARYFPPSYVWKRRNGIGRDKIFCLAFDAFYRHSRFLRLSYRQPFFLFVSLLLN